MTSKELKSICENCNRENCCYISNNCHCQNYNILESKLKVLNILKNHLEINKLEYLYKNEPKNVYYIDLIKKVLNEDEYNLLKEYTNE